MPTCRISAPKIAPTKSRVVGFALGYLGGGLLLAVNLALVVLAPRIGITTGLAVRLSLLSAGHLVGRVRADHVYAAQNAAGGAGAAAR